MSYSKSNSDSLNNWFQHKIKSEASLKSEMKHLQLKQGIYLSKDDSKYEMECKIPRYLAIDYVHSLM